MLANLHREQQTGFEGKGDSSTRKPQKTDIMFLADFITKCSSFTRI